MPVPSTVADLSSTASSNYPSGSESIGTSLDDYLRAHAAIIKQVSDAKADTTWTQSITGAVSRTISAKLREIVSVKDFGAVGDNSADDTSAINLAIASGAKRIYFPTGTYKISSVITITSPVVLFGDGPKETVIRQANATAGGIDFAFPSLIQGGGIQNISVEAGNGWATAGFQGSGSTGVGIKVTNSNGKFYAVNIGVHNFDTGISVFGCYYSSFVCLEVLYCTTNAIIVDKSASATGAGNWFTTGKLSNYGFTGTNTGSAGIRLVASGGDFFKSIDSTSFNNPVVIQPTAGKQVLYAFFDSVLGDTGLSDNWVIDGTADKVYSVQCIGCWGAYSTNGAGLVTKGANLDSVRWTGGRLRENGLQGWSHQGGLNVDLVGVEIASNSKLSANSYDGVLVAAGVSSWGIESCRIGNFASTLGGHANNIAIVSGASQSFRIIGNDLSNPGSGKAPISNSTSTQNFVISRNLPLQSAGNNTSDRIGLNGGSAGTPAAGSTVYLGAAGSYTSVNANPFVITKPGVVTGFYVGLTSAPGAGNTYTYTVYKNGVATAMTGQITGAGSFTVSVTTNAFTVAQNDLVTLQLVTSASAALSIHFYSIYLEP